MQHHLASSKRVGVAPGEWTKLKAGDYTSFNDKEQGALRFAEKLTRSPQSIADADIASLKQHFSEAEIVDLDLLIGLAGQPTASPTPWGTAGEPGGEGTVSISISVA